MIMWNMRPEMKNEPYVTWDGSWLAVEWPSMEMIYPGWEDEA